MQNVMHIATNAGHTAQNDGQTMQNDGRTGRNVGHNTLNVCQGLKGGLRSPSGPKGTPLPLYFTANKFPMVASHKTPILNLMALVSFWLNLGFFFNYP